MPSKVQTDCNESVLLSALPITLSAQTVSGSVCPGYGPENGTSAPHITEGPGEDQESRNQVTWALFFGAAISMKRFPSHNEAFLEPFEEQTMKANV